MPEYRRTYQPGGTFFFTVVTDERRPLFREAATVALLRRAVSQVRIDRPFEFAAGIVLPEHMHFLWTLPPGDSNYSWRIGRMKVLFTQSLRAQTKEVGGAHPTASRRKHREANVWQRRFWEHVIRDECDFENHLNYIHFNAVKHGLAACPHHWPHSSFARWVEARVYEPNWCCTCGGRALQNKPYPEELDQTVGE